MLGDLFTVYNIEDAVISNPYSHTTVYKTVIDYTSRYLEGQPVVVNIATSTFDVPISNPAELREYLLTNYADEIAMSPSCQAEINNLSRLPPAIFVMVYTNGKSAVIFVPNLAREEIKRSDWKSMMVILYQKGRTAERRVPTTNRAEAGIAIDLWDCGMFKRGCVAASI